MLRTPTTSHGTGGTPACEPPRGSATRCLLLARGPPGNLAPRAPILHRRSVKRGGNKPQGSEAEAGQSCSHPHPPPPERQALGAAGLQPLQTFLQSRKRLQGHSNTGGLTGPQACRHWRGGPETDTFPRFPPSDTAARMAVAGEGAAAGADLGSGAGGDGPWSCPSPLARTAAHLLLQLRQPRGTLLLRVRAA